MVLAIEPGPVPSPERSLHRKIEEASTRACLKTHAPNYFSVSCTQLVFQDEIVLEQGKVGGFPRKASQRWMKMGI
jgi:hypothetical protein